MEDMNAKEFLFQVVTHGISIAKVFQSFNPACSLKLFSSKCDYVCFPTAWLWAHLWTWLGQQNTSEVRVSQFPAWVSRDLKLCSLLESCQHLGNKPWPECLRMRTHREWSPTGLVEAMLDQPSASWPPKTCVSPPEFSKLPTWPAPGHKCIREPAETEDPTSWPINFWAVITT